MCRFWRATNHRRAGGHAGKLPRWSHHSSFRLKETLMHRNLIISPAAVLIFIAGAVVATRLETVHGQGQPGAGFAAVPGSKGGWDLTGPYDAVRDWPKPMSQLPGHENWGWGAVEGVFAESPNRVFIAQRGELPVMKRPPQT